MSHRPAAAGYAVPKILLALLLSAPVAAQPGEGSFTDRLAAAYRTHLAWNGADPAEPAPVVVGGAEVPVSNPPWPYATWNIGGTNAIGVENLYASAVMDALYCGPGGQALKDSRFTVYGWLEAGDNLSTSRSRYHYATGSGGNAPAAYSFQPNTVQLDQFALYFERTPDVVQRDHFDWGGRLTLLYGADYKYTFSNGVFSNQYLDRARAYGFDPVMYYLDFWFPKVASGMNVRVGRYISIPDIEAQLAPNNLTYSHSLLYTVDPYTQHGVIATVKLDRHWQVQAGLNADNDVGPWVKSERHLTPVACAMWTSDSGHDALYPCMNGLNDGHWRWDNVQHAVLTWYHKFNSRWHMDTELYYLWQSDTPNVDNAAGLARLARTYDYVTYGAPNGAHCAPALTSCYSYAYAAVNYINYQFGPRDIVTFRTDYLNDARGQRTGYRTRYYEVDLSYTHWVGDVIELRPELRFEHAREAPAYDNPAASLSAGRHSQVMLAADAVFHF
jgi:Putative beta-barrel porin-2, OmpL-like. bbp2